MLHKLPQVLTILNDSTATPSSRGIDSIARHAAHRFPIVGFSFSSKLSFGQKEHAGAECQSSVPIIRLYMITHLPLLSDTDMTSPIGTTFSKTKACSNRHHAKSGIPLITFARRNS